MQTIIKTLTCAAIVSSLCFSVAQADMQLNTQKAKPKMSIAAQGAAKPAVCGAGFTAVGKKLVTHEGKKWYEYTCAYQKTITRVCNSDTQVTDIKDKIVSLPSDGQSKKSKIQMSYKCFNYVPVE